MDSTFFYTKYNSSIGQLVLVSSGDKLNGIWHENQKSQVDKLFKNAVLSDDFAIFDATKDWLDRYFEGEKVSCDELQLEPMGSSFGQSVWRILCQIPYGKLITYGDIARQVGCKSAQAVGGAVGRNPISIIIPCHRVIGTNGTLTGYAGGLDIKKKLLKIEGIDTSRF